jgi:hypothetical protein
VPEFTQLDPVPLTVVVPAMPLLTPIKPLVSVSVPPEEITSEPFAVFPTSTVAATAVVVETVGPVKRLMLAVSAAPGAPAADQLVPTDQFVLVLPVQLFVAAFAGAGMSAARPAPNTSATMTRRAALCGQRSRGKEKCRRLKKKWE